MEVFGCEAFLQQYLHHSLQAALRDGLIIFGSARRACLGEDGELFALHASGERAQTVGLLSAHIRTVVGELYVVLGCFCHNLFALLTLYYQLFKKINIKMLYATILLTFTVHLLVDGVVMPAYRHGQSAPTQDRRTPL